MLSIYRKEINSFFSSLVGYIVIGVFLSSIGTIMWLYPDTSILDNEFATLDQLFIGAPLILTFIIPAITMRSFAEEHQLGTIELLATKPIKDMGIILGKFFAAMTLVILMLLPTLLYFYSIIQLGSNEETVDHGGVIGSYIGLLFLSGGFVAIGMLASSLTRNIIVSLILGIFLCFFFYWGLDLISTLPIYFGRGDTLIQMLGFDYHYNSLRRGLLDTSDLIYFISIIGIFLSLCLISFNSRKWWMKSTQKLSGQILEIGIGLIPVIIMVVFFSENFGLAASLIVGLLIGVLVYALTKALRNPSSSNTHALVQPLLAIPVFLFLAVLGSFIFTKFDLTDDQRYTLSDSTIEIVENVDEVMDITVLMGGDLPASYSRLQTATQDLLDDLISYNSNIEYTFENPLEGSDEQVRENMEALEKREMFPEPIEDESVEGGVGYKFIYPFAIVNYKGRTMRVKLLEDKKRGISEVNRRNRSVNLLEFNFVNTIQKLEASFRPVITYTKGHGELEPIEFADLRKSLSIYYDMGALDLDSLTRIDPNIDILMVPRPREELSEKDLFKIDQYIMNGGKVIMALDVMSMNLDSLNLRGGAPYISSEYPSAEKIGNLLFKYGLRIRPSNFVFDAECTRIPLRVGVQGGETKFELFDWFYHIMALPSPDHPIVKGLDRVNLFFPTVIDTSVGVRTNLKKHVLLSSSQNTRIKPNTNRFTFDEAGLDKDKMQFNNPNQPVAVLLEGIFPSAYRNRVSASMSATLEQIGAAFKEESIPTKMIVISDGDVMKNRVDRRSNAFDPLGFNRFENFTFANKDFMINCIEYLMDRKGVSDARKKVVELRLLNTVKAQKEKTFWQIFNTAIPLIVLVLFGGIYNFIRYKRYA